MRGDFEEVGSAREGVPGLLELGECVHVCRASVSLRIRKEKVGGLWG